VLPSCFNVVDEPSKLARSSGEELGYVCALLTNFPRRSTMRLKDVTRLVIPAMRHRQIKFFFSEEGNPVAYIIWAMVTEEVIDRIQKTERYDLHISEWNEGEELLILDLVAGYGRLKFVLHKVSDGIFKNCKSVAFFRHKKDRWVFKKISRKDWLSFFKT
jgi:cytolysin-activating lysine-acyltransferase